MVVLLQPGASCYCLEMQRPCFMRSAFVADRCEARLMSDGEMEASAGGNSFNEMAH